MRLRRDLLLFGLLAVAALAGGWWLLQRPGADRPGMDVDALGKATQKDRGKGKATFVDLMGLEAARRHARDKADERHPDVDAQAEDLVGGIDANQLDPEPSEAVEGDVEGEQAGRTRAQPPARFHCS